MAFFSALMSPRGTVPAPMRIARHALFTPKEKLALLADLKAEIYVALEHDRELEVTADEVDAAIATVKSDVQMGGVTAPVSQTRH